MGQVYQDSYLTVAASAAHNCYSSILSTPRAQWNEPLLVSLPNGSARPQIFVQQAPYHEVEQPLDSRLWAFQEYLMPPRLLRYMSDEIHFECLKLYGCECKPEVHDDGNNEMLETPWNARTLWRLFMDQDTEDLVRLRHEVWKQVITEASARILTRESDRLPAISGLAILYAAAAGPENRYLAGLWSENIIAGLVWQPMGPGTPSSNQSPSWSWASIDTDGMGHFYSEQTSSSTKSLLPGANPVNAWRALKGSNPFGEVTGGCLVLEAPIRLVMLQDIPLAYERSQIFSINRFSCLGVPLTEYRFEPDSELECSLHTLAGYATARRKRQSEMDTSIRPLTKTWSALLLYLSQEPYLKFHSSGFYSINEDVDLHLGHNNQSACKQTENGGCQHEDTRYKGPVKWIDNAETLDEHNSDQEIIRANFLVLGICRSSSTKDPTTETEEAEEVMSFQSQTFERLGYHDVFFAKQISLNAVLADFKTDVIRIE